MTSTRLKTKASVEPKNKKEGQTVFCFLRRQITLLQQIGKVGTAATYQQTLNSIMKYRQNCEMSFDDITPERMLAYEAWLHSMHLCRNTTSFYMRVLEHAEVSSGMDSYILDGTTWEKTGFVMEQISRGFDHVQGKCVLGISCWFVHSLTARVPFQ